jgi:hypothetical protein
LGSFCTFSLSGGPARLPLGGIGFVSRQDAKHAKKSKPDTPVSLGDLCVFARDTVLSLRNPYWKDWLCFPKRGIEAMSHDRPFLGTLSTQIPHLAQVWLCFSSALCRSAQP